MVLNNTNVNIPVRVLVDAFAVPTYRRVEVTNDLAAVVVGTPVFRLYAFYFVVREDVSYRTVSRIGPVRESLASGP